MFKFQIGFFGRWLRFYSKAKTRYDVHSPFVADFIEHVLEDKREFYPFSEIEEARQEFLDSRKTIEIEDHGAGSKAQPRKIRPVSGLARHGAIGPGTGRQLFKVVQHYRPSNILEMGTCLGISTLFLSMAAPSAKVTTIEGCANTRKLALGLFAQKKAKNIKSIGGTFRDKLPEVLGSMDKLDLLFLDGDHRKGPTIEYVKACLAKAGPKSIFILADIHWSEGMENAWEEVKALPEVTLSIDLFQIGLLFFDPAMREKADYSLIRAKFKIWRMGIGW